MNSISLESMRLSPKMSSVLMLSMVFISMESASTAAGTSSVKSSLRSPTSSDSSVLAVGRTLSRKEVRSGKEAESRSQVKGLVLWRGLGGLVTLLWPTDRCWSGVWGGYWPG